MPSDFPPENTLSLVNGVLTYGSITLFVLTAIFAMRDAAQLRQGRLLVVLMLSLAFLSLASIPNISNGSQAVYIAARTFSLPHIALFWLFFLSLLQDDFRYGRLEWIGSAAFTIAPVYYFCDYLGVALPLENLFDIYGNSAPFIMLGHVAWVALSGLHSDLLEPRRMTRLWLVLATVIIALFSLSAQYIPPPNHSFLLQLIIGVPAQIGFLLWLTRLQPEQLVFERPKPVSPPADSVASKELALHKALMSSIETERIFLRPSLSIDDLASHLSAPTHQLRHLINTSLGHRNFASFINAYRLKHAKMLLGDANRARDTVLEIAYESGFASLQSFNRVFKNAENITPSQYRGAALARASQN